jgi:hypothetical protein
VVVRVHAAPGEQHVGRLRVPVWQGPVDRISAATKWRDPTLGFDETKAGW